VQTAEGELEIRVSQIRDGAKSFVSEGLPNGRTAVRTRPLEALIIGRCGACRSATSLQEHCQPELPTAPGALSRLPCSEPGRGGAAGAAR
jgi:hypothetical protein